jgi:hypothetical protein
MTIHAHIDNASQDCDGPIYRSRIEVMRDDEAAGEFSEIVFRERVLNSEVSVYSCEDGTLQVSRGGFSWHENTDEGYRSAHVRWCEDDCDLEEKSYRDVYAEMMNY